MAAGSFARGALADLTVDDIRRMLELDESLFVEHKRDIGTNTHFQIAKAVASFANTLGGWLLIGVHEGKPTDGELEWASEGNPPLVDMIRDRLRGEVDPLPAFEAATVRLPDTEDTIGVIRVYESTDTPHVVVKSGAVYVREVAGDTDVAAERTPGATARERRRYQATQIRSQAQLRDLAQRGEHAAERVRKLLAVERRDSFVNERFGLTPWQPAARPGFGSIYVRAAPYTGADRFSAWATTDIAAAAAIDAAEVLSTLKGFAPGWAKPAVAGVWVEVGPVQGAHHKDSLSGQLDAHCDVAIESAGVLGAALHLGVPQDPRMRERLGVFTLAERFIVPPLTAVLGMLEAGGFLGRARCTIDCVALSGPVALEEVGGDAGDHVTVQSDISLPRDAAEVEWVSRLAGTALGRSAGLPTWDASPSVHSA